MSTVVLRFVEFQSALNAYFLSNGLHQNCFQDFIYISKIFTGAFEKFFQHNLMPAADTVKIFKNLSCESFPSEKRPLAQFAIAAVELEQTIDLLPFVDWPSYELKKYCKLAMSTICNHLQTQQICNVTEIIANLLGNNTVTQAASLPADSVPEQVPFTVVETSTPVPVNVVAVQRQENSVPMTSLNIAGHTPSRKPIMQSKKSIASELDEPDDGSNDGDCEKCDNEPDPKTKDTLRQCLDCEKEFDYTTSKCRSFCHKCLIKFDAFRGPDNRNTALSKYKQEVLKKSKKRKGTFGDSKDTAKLSFESVACASFDNPRTESILGSTQFEETI